jgi:hypothetical protein
MPGTMTGGRLTLAVALVVAALACSEGRDPIVVKDGMLVVENQTTRDWRNVRVTVNHHFSGGVAQLPAGGLMNAPLRDFQTGFGQRFDRSRMTVFRVEVSATDANGEPVSITWGE